MSSDKYQAILDATGRHEITDQERAALDLSVAEHPSIVCLPPVRIDVGSWRTITPLQDAFPLYVAVHCSGHPTKMFVAERSITTHNSRAYVSRIAAMFKWSDYQLFQSTSIVEVEHPGFEVDRILVLSQVIKPGSTGLMEVLQPIVFENLESWFC